MDERKQQVLATFLRVVNKILENQKKPRHYGLKELLYPAEIHAVMWIGENREVSVTELAEMAGVTKGAISQTLARLQSKQLVRKAADPVNKSRIMLELTSKGQRAFKAHQHMHLRQDRELIKFLDKLHPGEIQILEDFFRLLESGADKRR